MARQLSDGTWTSKCGDWEDIRHLTLDALETGGPYPLDAAYGSPVGFMKRIVAVGWLVRLRQFLSWKYREMVK